ncbi:MAG: hypothetical protein FVQ78_10875 [Solirubrobacterales bacterium]|nr:hypothetical protein [Solirubrobacterales bacterium]
MRPAAAIALVLLAALGVAGVARGEVEREGNVIVNFDGGISPRALPRSGVAPVAVNIDSTFRASDGTDPPPQLRQISIALNRGGKLFTRGLPTCRIRRIQPATIRAARRICRGAIVGSGRVRVRVNLDNQAPFTFKGPLLAFNARRAGGKRRILAQVYGRKPPSAFVLTFKVLKRKGTFGTVIRTTLPKAARKWAYVTHFEMKLRRTYIYRSKRRSYLSAGCAAPAGFPGAVYPFARAKFGFAGGKNVVSTLIRNCTVR